MPDQQPIPNVDRLAETIDVPDLELVLVDDDGADLDETQLLDQSPSLPENVREEVVWVSEQSEKTVIVPMQESDEKNASAASSEVAGYLRDLQIIELQRKWVDIELDPATERDTSGRPKFKKGDFGGLDVGRQKSLLGLFGQIFRMKEMPAYAVDLILGDPDFGRAVCEFLARQMDAFRCISRPYVFPDYSLEPIQLLRQSGCTLNIQHSVLRDMPRAHFVPKPDARILFFQMARNASPLEVEERYGKLGLRPLDFWELCAFNLKYPNFLVSQPNATHWVVGGDWRFAAFYTHDGDVIRRMALKRPKLVEGFIRGWYFAGVPIEA